MDNEKNEAAVELGRKGGKKGGSARDKKLSSHAKSLVAKKGAYRKWSKPWTDELEKELQEAMKESN